MYLIKRRGKVFVHVGIYVDHSLIYHYVTKNDNVLGGNHIVKKSNLEEFSLNNEVGYYSLEIVETDVLNQRAMEFSLFERPYNIITNNCITFVLFCLHGRLLPVQDMFRFEIKYKILLFSFLSPL